MSRVDSLIHVERILKLQLRQDSGLVISI